VLSLTFDKYERMNLIAHWFYNTTLSSINFQVAAETISNIQTVVSLGREEEFFERFRNSQVQPLR
jgi:hypothetical protein